MELFNTLLIYLQRNPYNKITLTIIAIISVLIIHQLLIHFTEKQIINPASRFRWRKTIGYSVTIIGLVIVSRVWFEGISSLTTFIGLLSAGLAIALKDLLVNLVGWIFILWRRPFQVGNRIQIGDHSGDVIDIRPFQFTVLEIGNWVKADQSTGRIIHIPNGSIFIQPLCNYDMGFKYIWNEIPVMITFESDWQKAKSILLSIVNNNSLILTSEVKSEIHKAAKQFLIFYHNLSPIVYTSVVDSGIVLTIRYLTEIRERRGSSEAIWESILISFSTEKNISLAYPTYRIIQDSSSETKSPQNKNHNEH